MAKDAYCILSIDGGGIRGILAARVLQHIEEKVGPATRLFDLIAGTSTGGILACGLLAGKTAKQLGDLYHERGGEIFSHSLWRTITTVANLEGPKYDPSSLEHILADQLGDMWLSDTKGPGLLIPTYVIELPSPMVIDGVPTTRKPMLFKNWKARGKGLAAGETADDFDFRLRDVARATAAAPTYFEPARIRNRKGDWYHAVDGGVFANNPAMCALTAAYHLNPDLTDRKVVVVSLGSGTLERPIPYSAAKGWGELRWLHPVLSMLMDGNADTVCYQMDEVLGADRHFRFEISTGTDPESPFTVNEDFDCATRDNIERLERLAEELIRRNGSKLDNVVSLLDAGGTVEV